MGDILGGAIGAVGSLVGGSKASSAEKQAAQQALTGYNYLQGNAAIQDAQSQGVAAGRTQSDLLGLSGDPAKTAAGFRNYLGSTGYQFQLNQGENAVAGSAAARGILNSGATAKALTQYGQGLSSTYFNNYFNQLGSLAGRGVSAAQSVGAAGSSGGANAGNFTAGAGQSTGSSYAQAGNLIGGALAGGGLGSISNFFAGL